MKKLVILILLCLAGFMTVQAQSDSTMIVSKDTIKVSGIELINKTSKSGKEYIKAQYMGRYYSISKKDIDIFDPEKTYIVFNQYNNGERKISKVIIK